MTQQFENFVNAALDKSLASDVTLPTANDIPVFTGIGRQVTGKTIAELGLATSSQLTGTNTGDETQASIKTKLGVASTGADGYLTSTDWNTFNGKLGLADVRFAFVSDSGTTYTVPASSVTAAGKTIIELSSSSLTQITVATTTATGKTVGDSVNIRITGTFNAQVLATGGGVVLEGDLVFYYQYQTKTLILKNAGTNTWTVVG